ncbi:unnamed protein product [Ectocarpus sp. 12 AP-2014]
MIVVGWLVSLLFCRRPLVLVCFPHCGAAYSKWWPLFRFDQTFYSCRRQGFSVRWATTLTKCRRLTQTGISREFWPLWSRPQGSCSSKAVDRPLRPCDTNARCSPCFICPTLLGPFSRCWHVQMFLSLPRSPNVYDEYDAMRYTNPGAGPDADSISNDEDDDDVPVGAIVGGVIGGVLFLAAVIILVVLFKKGCLKPCACGDSCACCEPGPPATPAPAGVGSAPSVVKGYPQVYSSAAVAQPPPPAYEGPGNVPPPGVQAYPAAAATAAPPAYGGPVRNQYPAPA